METKKSKKADLESKRPIFFMIGLAISLGMVLLAFEWKSPEKAAIVLTGITVEAPEDILIPIVKEEKKEELPPVVVVEEFVLVDNTIEIEDEPFIFEDDITSDDAIDYQKFLPKEKVEEVVEPTWFPEQQPEFPGGMKALLKFINNSVKYPIVAQESAIQGKVIITFVIDADGEVTDVKILRGSILHWMLKHSGW